MHLSPEIAWSLVNEYVTDSGLKRHVAAVGAAMAFYADQLSGDPVYWEAIGIAHDFDWEIHPDLDRHPMEGAKLLRSRGWDDEPIRVILSHYTEGTGIERENSIDYALLACDEITGLIIATALVRPSRDVRDVTVRSIKKKWKDRRFAAGVDRDHVERVTAEFSEFCFSGKLDLWSHIENVLMAMQVRAADLDLDGQ